MLEFRQIRLADRDRINMALEKSGFMGCEYSFANNLAWCRLAGSEICFFKDFYIICAFDTDDNIPLFTLPAGAGDYREVIHEMKRFSENYGYPLQIGGVTENSLRMLDELFPDKFDFTHDRDGSDYIYRQSDLAELAGKKYHHKRTHLARFNELDYEFSIIMEKDYDDCIKFITDDYNSRQDSGKNHSAIAEQYAVNTFFSFFEELNLSGGIIRINGKIAAVTVGEKLNSDTFGIHIEKADRNYNGIYAGINNCFIRACTDGYTYINREEDLGIDGLRKSKLSYYPAFLLNKYVVKFK
ncbi:MAG: phosphatidylglycerol lysyltransferase domain-containing protein [Ruminococcus sp.]|nr:phosphatidylglycerol lysyltransferase domain-containing protein [Ruminococcus sp.]